MTLRLADLLAGLSRLADLGFGLTAGEAVRSASLAVALGRDLGLPDEDVRAAMYTALLHHVGCPGYAHETARLFGDELVVNAAAARVNETDPRDFFGTFLPAVTRGKPPVERVRLAFAAVTGGGRFSREFTTAACEVGRDAARRLGLPDAVQEGLYHVYELWRGHGFPSGLAGDDIPLASRLARLTGIAVLFDSVGGTAGALDAVRRRSAGMLDPGLADAFTRRADGLLADLNGTDPRAALIDAEPDPPVTVPVARLVDVATVFADLADLKTPYTHGHSRGVAALACGAARRLTLDADELEVAGLLHDVGRVAVSAAVWDRPGPLGGDDWEQVRLHAYHSERILAGSARLAGVARIVGLHHERLDGTGYHRGCRAADLPLPARVLAAADVYQALISDRPHRAALGAEQAELTLLAEAGAGRLDTDAVRAVLQAAGRSPTPTRRSLPAGLTEREVEVLRLLAEGGGNPAIAARLVISRRTAEHHVQHIYAKIGVSSRAAAALFAMEHDLLG